MLDDQIQQEHALDTFAISVIPHLIPQFDELSLQSAARATLSRWGAMWLRRAASDTKVKSTCMRRAEGASTKAA